jgi:hypothetical protein
MALVLKTSVPQGTVGSNPTLSVTGLNKGPSETRRNKVTKGVLMSSLLRPDLCFSRKPFSTNCSK